MAPIKVSVKWTREVFEDVEVSPEDGLEMLKAQLFALTNVPPERQKIMCKGKILKSEADLSKVKDNSKIVLMGSADALVQGPSKEIVFEEDLTDSQKANMGVEEVPPGLTNLGNTCYLNSAISCLRWIPELKDNLIKYSRSPDTESFGSRASEAGHRLAVGLGHLLAQLESSVNAVTPYSFLSTFRALYPQFDQKGPHGHLQQDADESLSQIMYALRQQLPKFPGQASADSSTGVNGLFQGEMESTITCDEDETEEKSEVQVKMHEFTKLRCHISIETNHLSDGMNAALEEKIEKCSEKLRRNAVFTKRDKISKLPPYLMVQFVRFYWKKDTQMKAKILRKVLFPHRLDVLPMCSDKLKAEVSAYRDEVDRRLEAEKERAEKKEKEDFEKAQAALEAGGDSMQVDPAVAESKQEESMLRKASNPHVEKSTGMYELFALITHKGRAADSGHYIGWARGEKENEWFKFDDDVVTKQTDDDILNLSGGGDWHMAYVCFYRACPWRM